MASSAVSGNPVLHLALTGPFTLSGPEPIAITGKKNRALFAVLALAPGQRVTRQRLCGLLWGERMEDQARSSLRQSLAVLRKELGDHADVLVTRDDLLGLDSNRISIDVLRFSALAGQADLESLSQAADLLSGELLADTVLKEEGFTEWLESERRALLAQATGVLEKLAAMPHNPGRLGHARRLVDLDPLREASHRALMQSFADEGDRAKALRQFDICRDLLRKELDVEPSSQTVELRGRIAGAAGTGSEIAPVVREGALAGPSQRPLIIVRPFEAGAAEGGNTVLAAGVGTDLVEALCRFSEIEVAPPGHEVRHGQRCFTLTGSVRWRERVRVTVELMDDTGRVIWAQRYDRAPGDIFAIQDEIVEACVYNLVNVVNRKTLDEVKAGRGSSVSAYRLFLQGRSHAYRLNRDDLFKARALLGDAIRADPEFAPAHAWLSEVHWLLWWGGIVNDAEAPRQALACARLAVNLDSDDQHGLAELGQALYTLGRFEEARIALDRAMASNPNNPDVLTILAYYRICCGDAGGALDAVRKAMRLDPAGHYGLVHGIVLYCLDEWAPSIVHLRMVRAEVPAVKAWLSVSLAMAGQAAEAMSIAADLRREWSALHGNAPVAGLLLQRFPFMVEADRRRLATGLARAGLDGGPMT